jgi:hypothetical protein
MHIQPQYWHWNEMPIVLSLSSAAVSRMASFTNVFTSVIKNIKCCMRDGSLVFSIVDKILYYLVGLHQLKEENKKTRKAK